jgi:hypothetical protein
MKKAVIVVGKHHAGKSLTIRGHLNPLLGISYDAHKFKLNGKCGYILSQSFEESLRDFLETCKKYFAKELLVFAARPATESGSKLNLIRDTLQKASFKVIVVNIQDKSEAPAKAKEVFSILNSN